MQASENSATSVYAADVTVLQDPALFDAAYRLATPERKLKTDRYRQQKDQWLSLGAELLLRHGLRQAGVAFPTAFSKEKAGKPCLPDNPVYFNLSHSGKWALCVISEQEAGCDVEAIRPDNLSIARCFAKEEYEDILSRRDPLERLILLTRYWTLKESFMKATGLGMQLPLQSFRIVTGPPVTVIRSCDEQRYGFAEYDTLPGYRCALCTAGDPGRPELAVVDLREAVRNEGSR